MPDVTDLEILNIGGQKHLVREMSEEVQQIVAVYNEWNRDAAEATKRANQLQFAVQKVHDQLTAQIQQEQADEQAKQEAQLAAGTAEEIKKGLVNPADGDPLIANDLTGSKSKKKVSKKKRTTKK